AAILRDDGITILTSSTPARVEPADGGRLRLTVRTEDGERQLEGSHLLSAIGRIPNTEALTPEAAGIRLNDHGFIEVDEYLQTSVPGVYAMGDVKGGPAFTHLSYDDYRILHANRQAVRQGHQRPPSPGEPAGSVPAPFRRGPDTIARGNVKLLLGQVMLDEREKLYHGLCQTARGDNGPAR